VLSGRKEIYFVPLSAPRPIHTALCTEQFRNQQRCGKCIK
jgi:hypothetical protein